jgi:hypothetical protein
VKALMRSSLVCRVILGEGGAWVLATEKVAKRSRQSAGKKRGFMGRTGLKLS